MDIKKIRKELNLSQEEFAKLIGVSRATVINYEKGEVIPESKKEMLGKLLDNKKYNIDNVSHNSNEPDALYQTEKSKLKDELIEVQRALLAAHKQAQQDMIVIAALKRLLEKHKIDYSSITEV